MGAPLVSLTGQQRNALQNAVDNPHLAPSFADMGANPKVRVFMANFDGTFNDNEDVPYGESETIVSLIHKDALKNANPRFASHYSAGVGTRTKTAARKWHEGGTGDGCESRAEAMHRELVMQTQKWLKEDPEAIIHVCASGFSRGAATAVHFLNLVHDRGAIVEGASPERAAWFTAKGAGPGAVKSSAMLLDLVATGQEKVLKLALPPSTQASLHLVAAGEERRHFKVTQLSDARFDKDGKPMRGMDNEEWAEAKNVGIPPLPSGAPAFKLTKAGTIFYQCVKEITLAGARHSDVGGAYEKGGIAKIPLYLTSCFLRSLGIPGSQPVKPQLTVIQRASAHDSRDRIELARQATDALVGRTFTRAEVEREAAKRHAREWDGHVLRTVRLTLFDDDNNKVGERIMRINVPHEDTVKFPNTKGMGIERSVLYDPHAQKTLAERAQEVMSTGITVHATTSIMMFKGMRIDDMDEPDSLAKIVFDKTPNRRIEVSVMDQRKFSALHDGRQAVPAGQVIPFDFGKDQWPESIRKGIAVMNAREDLDPSAPARRPSALMDGHFATYLTDGMESAAQLLIAEFPDIENVSFEIQAQKPQFKDNTDPFRVVALVQKGGVEHEYGVRKEPANPDELEFRQRVGQMVAGIAALAKMMHKQQITVLDLGNVTFAEMTTANEETTAKRVRPG